MFRLIVGLVFCVALLGCGSDKKSTPDAASASAVKELIIEDVKPGTGDPAANGDLVIVLYRGTLMNGTEFDGNMTATYEANPEKAPYPVELGVGGVIEGWQKGLIGAKEGMIRNLVIPAKLAYGAEGSGERIPPNADLKFTLKILKLQKKGAELVIDAKNVVIGTGPEVKEGGKVNLKYKGTMLNGKVFDERASTGLVPITRVVPSIKAAIMGMKKGGKRTVTIPPGMFGSYSVDRSQYLNFEIEVLDAS